MKSTVIWNGAAVSVAISVALRKNSTWVTPIVSLAVACSVVEPGTSTVPGWRQATLGGVMSAPTETLTTALVVLLPAASKALAVKPTLPMSAGVKRHRLLYGAVVSVPISVAPR